MQEIIIDVNEQKKKTIVISENGNLVERYEEENQKRIEGNIYIGKVTDVLPGMQAAFIDIGEEKNAFIHLKDILPKKDILNEEVEKIEQEKSISYYLKRGDILTVQVKRDATSKKGPKVSRHLSLPSRFLVLMPDVNFITISQKIEQEQERQRLLKIVKKYLPDSYGAIIRTASEGKTEKEIQKDLKEVLQEYEKIQQACQEKKQTPRLIYRGSNLIQKILVDVANQNMDRILVNDQEVYVQVENFLKKINNHDTKLELRQEPLLKLYNLEEQIEKLKERKIWLKCGGFITIDKTEALTAIDVNSGKYTGNKDLEQTVFKVNKEASIEIAKQLKLRDIGGIIIIDYIDMLKKEDEEKITQILKENLKKDRSKTQVVGFTKLNLLEMTRKHMFSE